VVGRGVRCWVFLFETLIYFLLVGCIYLGGLVDDHLRRRGKRNDESHISYMYLV